jgi:hypothetical protein
MSVLAATALAVTIALPGNAIAAPDNDPSLASAPTVSLTTLGAGVPIALYGIAGSQTLTFPVPPGLVPAELTATIQMPVNMHGGILEVVQDDRAVSRTPLPLTDQAPIVIPLVGARIVDNSVAVLLRSYLVPPEGYCVFDPTNPLRLVGTSVRFTGQELPPATIADFLPPVLSKLTVFVPGKPSRSESDAAIRLATATIARYGQQRPAIDVVPLAGDSVAPPQPLERQIIVRERPGAGLSLQGPNTVPALVISGESGELTNQARLVSSDISKLAVSSKAVAGPLSSTPQLPPDLTTIRKLGQPGVNATALVNPQVTIPLDQTRLGRSVHGVRVHLQGSYTPLPASISGQVLVKVGGETLSRWTTDATGRIDIWVDVPDRLLQRYTSLDVSVNAAGNTGRCGEFQPITLTIDGESAVQTSLAKPPVPGGFQALPQALMPRMEVGLEDGFDNLRRAVLILSGLQRLSSRPFDTETTSVQDAVASPNPAVLISANGWNNGSITLPVTAGDKGAITLQDANGVGQSGTITLDPAQPFGSLQTTYAGGRTVLIATSNNAPQELDRLLGWLDADVAHWSGLTSNAVLAFPGRAPVTVTTDAAAPEAPQPADRSALYWTIGGLVLVALAGGLIALRSKRSRGSQ